MKQPRRKLARTIADKTLQSGLSKQYAQQIAAYLLQEGRVRELNSLLRDIQADWVEAGIVEVVTSSAHPLSATTKAEIMAQIKQRYPQAKSIIITEEIDPSVLGGVRVTLANEQLDLSVEAKLNKFKQLTTAGKD